MTRTLTMGRPRERAPALLEGLDQTPVTMRGGLAHAPTASFHRDVSRTPPNLGG